MLVADGGHAIACGEQHITGLVFEKATAAGKKIAAAFPDPGSGALESGDIGDPSGGNEFRDGLRSARVAGLHPEQESGLAARLENLRGALNLGAARFRRAHRLAEEFAELSGCGDFGSVFGHWPQQGDRVGGLVGGLDALLEGNLAADGQNRISLGGGGGQTGRKISHARSGSGQHHTDAARHSTHRGSHEGGILFVATEDELNVFRGHDRLENAVNFRTWNTENMANAKIFEHVDKSLGTRRLCDHWAAF